MELLASIDCSLNYRQQPKISLKATILNRDFMYIGRERQVHISKRQDNGEERKEKKDTNNSNFLL